MGCTRAAPPDVVVVMTDDQHWSTLTSDFMPATWRLLVERGVRFSNFFTTTATCCPSRVSFLTGNDASRHGIHHNTGELTAGTVDQDTLVTRLDAAGYRTGLFGKYLNNYDRLGPPHRATWYIPPGWDAWAAFVFAGYHEYDLVTGPASTVHYGYADADYSTDVIGERATAFVGQALADGVPFFVLAAPFAPHDGQLRVPKRHAGRWEGVAPWRPPSWGEADLSGKGDVVRAIPLTDASGVSEMDAYRQQALESLLAVDELVAALWEATRPRGNTIFVVTSDNGVNWYEHRLRPRLLLDDPGVVARAKNTPYDGAHRVPLVISWPERLGDEARVEPGLATMPDLSASLATWAGLAPPGQDGISFATRLPAGLPLTRTVVPLEGWNADGTPLYAGWRTATQKEFAWADGFVERYDLLADPWELRNLAARP